MRHLPDFAKIILLILIPIIVIVALVLLATMDPIKAQPVQNMHVEVVGKRIFDRDLIIGGIPRGTVPVGIVAFQYPDGSEKEFEVASAVFKELHESDTGMLSFQEDKNIDHWEETMKWAHRYFISFEKDS